MPYFGYSGLVVCVSDAVRIHRQSELRIRGACMGPWLNRTSLPSCKSGYKRGGARTDLVQVYGNGKMVRALTHVAEANDGTGVICRSKVRFHCAAVASLRDILFPSSKEPPPSATSPEWRSAETGTPASRWSRNSENSVEPKG